MKIDHIFYYFQVIKAESLFTLMVAKHNCSFSLADHFTKLAPVMFPDSEIARQYGCKRTKTMAIIRGKTIVPVVYAAVCFHKLDRSDGVVCI